MQRIKFTSIEYLLAFIKDLITTIPLIAIMKEPKLIYNFEIHFETVACQTYCRWIVGLIVAHLAGPPELNTLSQNITDTTHQKCLDQLLGHYYYLKLNSTYDCLNVFGVFEICLRRKRSDGLSNSLE